MLHDWLNVTLPDYPGIDILRLFTVFVAGFVMVRSIHYFRHRRKLHGKFYHLTVAINLLVALLFCAQEAEQIGQRFLIWRLPTIIVILALILLQISEGYRLFPKETP